MRNKAAVIVVSHISTALLMVSALLMSAAAAESDITGEPEWNRTNPNTLNASRCPQEDRAVKAPALAVNGPFAEHLVRTEPKMLENQTNVSEEFARKRAAGFAGINQGRVCLTGKSSGSLPAYYFSVSLGDGDLTVSVSERGGHVISLFNSTPVGVPGLPLSDAVKIAERFLKRQGYHNMKPTYYSKLDGTCTVNFAYLQDDVLCYCDLVKVGIALDTGSIVSFESLGYLMAHHERELPRVEITQDSARGKIAAGLEVQSTQLALIPVSAKGEILCYEFECSAADGRRFLIYVNVSSGEHEKTLLLLETDCPIGTSFPSAVIPSK